MSKKAFIIGLMAMGIMIAGMSIVDKWDAIYKCPDCGKVIYPGTKHSCK